MKYYKLYREPGSEYFEITKEEARQTLESYYTPECIDRIFNEELSFRLCTSFSTVWAETENGEVLIPSGFYYGVEEREDGKCSAEKSIS